MDGGEPHLAQGRSDRRGPAHHAPAGAEGDHHQRRLPDFEEASKGTLEPGKRADLVVVSENPVTVEPMAIRDIKVLETVKDGQTSFSATAQ